MLCKLHFLTYLPTDFVRKYMKVLLKNYFWKGGQRDEKSFYLRTPLNFAFPGPNEEDGNPLLFVLSFKYIDSFLFEDVSKCPFIGRTRLNFEQFTLVSD